MLTAVQEVTSHLTDPVTCSTEADVECEDGLFNLR